jgi:nucleoside-diphosphate-sugar epimerase
MNSLVVTGIGGFIGRRIAERALSRGVSVRGIDQSVEAVAAARDSGIDAEVGDVTDEARVRQIVSGADTVIHTAAVVRESGAWALFRAVNVEGSRRVARAARDAGARTFVQLSSVMVYGFAFPPQASEEAPLRGENNPYCQTKIESEHAVLELNGGDFGVVVIRPGDVYGPGSVPWVKRPLDLMRRHLLVVPRGGVINTVYVDNLVDGIFLAIGANARGQAFNVSDGVATAFGDYFAALARRAGLRPPRVLPAPVVKGAARAMGALGRLGIGKDLGDTESVRYLMRPHAYSIAKARKVLGYEPRIGLEEGLGMTQAYIDETVRT